MEIQEVQTKAMTLAENARKIQISTKEDYERAGELCRALDEMEKKAHELCDPVCASTFKSHRDAVSLRSTIIDPITAGRKLVKQLMGSWKSEQERLAQLEQARVQTQVATKQQDIIIQQAIAAEAMGDSRTATTILSQPISTPTIVVKADIPKTKGVVFQTRWKFEIIDENLIPREFMTPDMEKIRKVVNALKSQANIPGVRAISYEA